MLAPAASAEEANVTGYGLDATIGHEPSFPVDLRWLALRVRLWLPEVEFQDSTGCPGGDNLET